jgi:hypothetical protein
MTNNECRQLKWSIEFYRYLTPTWIAFNFWAERFDLQYIEIKSSRKRSFFFVCTYVVNLMPPYICSNHWADHTTAALHTYVLNIDITYTNMSQDTYVECFFKDEWNIVC